MRVLPHILPPTLPLPRFPSHASPPTLPFSSSPPSSSLTHSPSNHPSRIMHPPLLIFHHPCIPSGLFQPMLSAPLYHFIIPGFPLDFFNPCYRPPISYHNPHAYPGLLFHSCYRPPIHYHPYAYPGPHLSMLPLLLPYLAHKGPLDIFIIVSSFMLHHSCPGPGRPLCVEPWASVHLYQDYLKALFGGLYYFV